VAASFDRQTVLIRLDPEQLGEFDGAVLTPFRETAIALQHGHEVNRAPGQDLVGERFEAYMCGDRLRRVDPFQVQVDLDRPYDYFFAMGAGPTEQVGDQQQEGSSVHDFREFRNQAR
jgi:hypothetical protein